MCPNKEEDPSGTFHGLFKNFTPASFSASLASLPRKHLVLCQVLGVTNQHYFEEFQIKRVSFSSANAIVPVSRSTPGKGR